MTQTADVPVPYWPAYLPAVKPEAASAAQYWLTPAAEVVIAAEADLAEPEAGA